MKIVVVSGKGGTGKTTVSASMSAVWPNEHTVVDLDVEEPNLHLFLKPNIYDIETVTLAVPKVDNNKCIKCRKCVELCKFSALSLLGDKLFTFSEMCHSCGGCFRVCPVNALSSEVREIGVIQRGKYIREVHDGDTNSIDFINGVLNIGEALSPPLASEIKKIINDIEKKSSAMDFIIDGPPGTSCPSMNAINGADYALVVVEPTAFGIHDMKLLFEAIKDVNIQKGVVINKSGDNDYYVIDYCKESNIPVIGSIPYDRNLAEAYSNSKLFIDYSSSIKSTFEDMAQVICDSVNNISIVDTHASVLIKKSVDNDA